MSHWNYRVIRKHHLAPDSVTYHVHEVYYREDGGIENWTQAPVVPMGETAAALREDLKFFLHAFRRPILEIKETDEGTTLASDDATYEEILRELTFERMVERGLADSREGHVISNEKMEHRIRSW